MDKKYIADKRNKSKKYKNTKYNKKEETTEKEKNHGFGDTTHKSKLLLQETEEIPNNWSRYEVKNDDDDDNNDICLTGEGANYETLLLAPVSVDSNFKFKSEKSWDDDIKSQTNLSKYFTLNIALLNEGVSCVPFIKRQGYDETIISVLELELMQNTSEKNLKRYKELLERKCPQKSDIIITKNSDIIKPQIPKGIPETSTITNKTQNNEIIIPEVQNITINTKDDDVDDLLNLKCADLTINDESDNIKVEDEDPLLEKTEISKVIAPPQPTVDLEQWLDDILDD